MDLSKDQADDIVRNRQNPQYQRYHDGDKAINESVTRAYLKQIPGEYDPSDSTPPPLRTPPEKASNEPDNQAGVDEAEAQLAAAQATLRQLWGDAAEANVGIVADWAQTSLGTQKLDSLHEQYPGLLNDPEVVVALHTALTKK